MGTASVTTLRAPVSRVPRLLRSTVGRNVRIRPLKFADLDILMPTVGVLVDSLSLSHQEDPRTGWDWRDGAERSGAKRGMRLLCAPHPPRTRPSRTIAPILAPEPSVLVRKAHCTHGGRRSCSPVLKTR